MPKQYEILKGDITKNRRLSSKKIYVISSFVRVRKNVRLIVEDGTVILIKNGVLPNSKLMRAALVFDQGSILRAKRLNIKACNSDFRQVKMADNGGLWFLGNSQSASKDKLTIKANRKAPLSSFKADVISTHYLGRLDPLKETTHTMVVDDDIDGISVLGVSQDEWEISEVRSFYSGDDGIDISNSHLTLSRLKVIHPTEDGINLSSSRLEVKRSLIVDVAKTKILDRDIFDFETGEGACYLELAQHCHIDIRGVFGDELVLSSSDMPKIKKGSEAKYQFKGRSQKAATLIYSINLD
jgi:hypothetical protein